jgi:5'-nucleotidase
MNCSTNGGLPTTVSIVHFNDVYDIEPCEQEPVGGAARFVTAVRQLNDQNPLVLFSGDAFNPSLLSTVTHGKQMVPVLNAIGVHCALYGSHDFDFGVDNLVKVGLFWMCLDMPQCWKYF